MRSNEKSNNVSLMSSSNISLCVYIYGRNGSTLASCIPAISWAYLCLRCSQFVWSISQFQFSDGVERKRGFRPSIRLRGSSPMGVRTKIFIEFSFRSMHGYHPGTWDAAARTFSEFFTFLLYPERLRILVNCISYPRPSYTASHLFK